MEGLSNSDVALLSRNGNGMFGGDAGFFWIFALLILAGGGFNGGFGANGNVASEIAASNNAQTSQLNQQSILLSSERNNYETARLVTQQTEALMNQNNTNLINAIQGFNQLSQQVANQTSVIGSKLDQLGFQMENCCCSIKTLIKDNQIADLQNQLNQANNLAVNAQQSQYLLSQLGKFVPTTAAAAG